MDPRNAPLGTYRNLTGKFEAIRTQLRSSRRSSSFASPTSIINDTGRDPLLGHDNDSDHLVAPAKLSLTPEYVEIAEQVQKNIIKIREFLKELTHLHEERLKVKFNSKEAEQDRDIDIHTQEIKKLLEKSGRSLKAIATTGTDHALPPEEVTIRLNSMRALGMELSELGRGFRNANKHFLDRLRGQEEFGSSSSVGGAPLSEHEAADGGLTEEQMESLQHIDGMSKARMDEVMRIAQSVQDLSVMFKELNQLVIEQGTVLDRIDYNVERALDNTKIAVEELKIADKHRTGKGTKCILVLLLLNVLLGLILGFRRR